MLFLHVEPIAGCQLGRAVALEGAAPKCGAAASKVTALPYGEPPGGRTGIAASREGRRHGRIGYAASPPCWRLWVGGGMKENNLSSTTFAIVN